MDDWVAPADDDLQVAAPKRLRYATQADPAAVEELVALLEGARTRRSSSARARTTRTPGPRSSRWPRSSWRPSGRRRSPRRAGFPQDHPLFAGFLSHARDGLRSQLAGHDVILSVGAPVFRQYAYVPGPLLPDGATIGLITDDADEAHRSPADVALLAPPASACRLLAERVSARDAQPPASQVVPPAPAPPAPASR